MMKMLGYGAMLLLGASAGLSQTLTFLLRNAQVIAGPKFQYEVWIKSSSGTTRMGSILVYNNYNTLAFGVSVASNSNATVTKNTVTFGTSYAQNPTNDNIASRFAYSWTYLGGAGSGVVIPSTGDGVLAFTVQINIININQHAGLTYEQGLMDGEQYEDDEATPWPVVDASDFIDPPLPIQLSSFTGTPLGNGRVRLDWTTLSEINNYGFEMQRRGDTLAAFQTLPNSFIPGHGTTNEPHSYMFVDSSVVQGHWWYRLRQIDLDGSAYYGNEIAVDDLTGVGDHGLPTVFALHQNYPNPFNPSTRLEYDLPEAGDVSLVLYDVLGRRVAELAGSHQVAGYHSVTWNASNQASGVYLARFNFTDPGGHVKYSKVDKLVLMK